LACFVTWRLKTRIIDYGRGPAWDFRTSQDVVEFASFQDLARDLRVVQMLSLLGSFDSLVPYTVAGIRIS